MDVGNDQGKHKNTRGAKRRMTVASILMICFVLYGSYQMVYNLLLSSRKSEELKSLEQQYAEQLEDNRNYRQEILNLQDPVYREEQARTKQNMKKKNEEIINYPENLPN